jgi:hypothetical protein
MKPVRKIGDMIGLLKKEPFITIDKIIMDKSVTLTREEALLDTLKFVMQFGPDIPWEAKYEDNDTD